MNKTAIKNFATWARNKLIADITYKAGLMGVTDKGISDPLPQSTGDIQFFDIGTSEPYSIIGKEIQQRKRLVDIITAKAKQSDYSTAFNAVVEEVAYTWFNRLIAVRFMEANDYLPSRIRVLSSESKGKAEPDLVTAPFDSDLDFSSTEKELIAQLKLENKLDELFRMLFIKQCNTLNKILPELFEKTSDYTELLLNISCTDPEGVVAHLVKDIEEDDFKEQVQIIGWLYQYYISEKKDEAFANLKKNVKITKENIPAATQLFTPDWIVKYMVENSLGRLAVEKLNLNPVGLGWKYYLTEAEQTDEVKNQLKIIRSDSKTFDIKNIKIIDPCMGSGHILAYAFDVLMQIYESQGYSKQDAATLILQKNLYGLDIDKRAYQLACFSLMMKGRQHNRRIFTEGVAPQVYCPDGYADGEEYGSLLSVDDLENMPAEPTGQMTLDDADYAIKLNTWNFRRLLAQKYDVVVTNPPYMGSSGMGAKLSEYVKKNFPDSKSDLFAVFIEKCGEMLKPNGLQAMITQHAFMFLSSYEKLRAKLLLKDIVNMAHLGARAFEEIGGEVVQTSSFVLRQSNVEDYKSTFVRLVDFKSQQAKEEAFLSGENRHIAQKENFAKIPGMPMAYWVSERFNNAYSNSFVRDFMDCKSGIMTGNDKFVKQWHEVNINYIKFDCESHLDMDNFKWFPLNSGGEYRKYFGNNSIVVDLWNGGSNIKKVVKNFRLRDANYYFRNGITWGRISSSKIAFRDVVKGSLFGDAGPIGFVDDKKYYLLGFLNSKVSMVFLNATNPTMNFQVHDIENLPIITNDKADIDTLVTQNIAISRTDWDSFETSWDFVRHPLLIAYGMNPMTKEVLTISTNSLENLGTLEYQFYMWKQLCENNFNQLKANEEELNRIFIDIYGLQDELTPEVANKDVTVARIYDTKEDIPESMKGNRYALTKSDVVKSFISYAVGCMFGRYSLDVEGLSFAGGDWDSGKYSSFIPDKDNILPITNEAYYEDDIVGRLEEFVEIVYGEQMLEENLEFIAIALGNKGGSSREIIRAYFVKDFFKDHCKVYKKRPIYWLFDSGKQDGFKALVYMHRYDENTIGNLRIDYLHRIQRVYDSEIVRMQETIENSTDGREITTAEKRKEKLIKQLKETKDYDINIAHLALARIAIDLDDGVKVNYEKVQTDTEGNKLDVLGKI